MGAAPDLLDHRLLFFTGKGGVGKSTVTAATALLAAEHGQAGPARRGRRQGQPHRPLRARAGRLRAPSGAPWRVRDADGHRGVVARVPQGAGTRARCSGRLGPIARAFDFVATAAPGVKEILTVGKVCWELRESLQGRADWDLIVVDAAATGHVISQLDAPEAIQELVQVGPVRSQTDWMVELLSDPALDRAQHGHRARGDAGQRDDRAGRPCAAKSSTFRSAW